MPDGSVNAYGFYTGSKKEWENVPVVAAKPKGNSFSATLTNGLEVIWTPVAASSDKPGVPALQAGPRLANIWVYPPTAPADQILNNPAHPPEFHDTIIWFPQSGIPPIYIVLSTFQQTYHPPPDTLAAFPDAEQSLRKTLVKGGGGKRKRWTDREGFIYEWDSRHGKVEKYNKRGKHLGEFDPKTGAQTKDADKTRKVEP